MVLKHIIKMAISTKCVFLLLVAAVVVDFYFYVKIFFIDGQFDRCPLLVMNVDINKIEFFLFWTTVILCSLPVKSTLVKTFINIFGLAFTTF
jgi:hypothetical protein